MTQTKTVKKTSTKKPVKTATRPISKNAVKTVAKTSTPEKRESAILKKAMKVARIEKLPKTCTDSIPIKGFLQNGIIEVSPGVFTKSYKLDDINFTLASSEDQERVYRQYMDFLNSFGDEFKWQVNIFKKEVRKQKTMDDIRLTFQQDGKNLYRKELNSYLLKLLKQGNASVEQTKYLTVSITDNNIDHAVSMLSRVDSEINTRLKQITGKDTRPISICDRLKLLYNIYNPEADYRLSMFEDDKEKEDLMLKDIVKNGLSIKDAIGPAGISFLTDHLRLGDRYAEVLYLKKVPSQMRSSFMADLSDLQNTMLISATYEKVENDKARKMIKNRLSNIEAKASDVQKRNLEDGYFGALPPELEASQASARDLFTDITERDQNLFFVTMTVVLFARTKELLNEYVKAVKNVANKYMAPIEELRYQQEFGFNTALPLCRNDIFAENLFTTESAAIFIPYNTQEINQKKSILYGMNTTSKTMVLYNRLTSNNYNGLIFGSPGSGKSFAAKLEIVNVLLNQPEAEIHIIDPQGEYDPLVNALGGVVVRLAPGSSEYINPMDLNIARDAEIDPITLKTDFVLGMIGVMLRGIELPSSAAALVDMCVRKIYNNYIEELNARGITYNPAIAPTLRDLYKALEDMRHDYPEAGELAKVLLQYTQGSFDTFAHRSSIRTGARITSYNIQRLGTSMKELGLFIIVSDVFNKMAENKKHGKTTWLYIDEFHILLESPQTTTFLIQIWKMARKWGGVPTGIMQNPGDLATNQAAKTIIKNTEFVLMFKSSVMDRQDLATLFNLSESQLHAITNVSPGKGLLWASGTVVPIDNSKFPTDTKIYKLINTKAVAV